MEELVDDKLPQDLEGEEEMIELSCLECEAWSAEKPLNRDRNQAQIVMQRTYGAGIHVEAVLTCKRDKHQWPITFEGNRVISTGQEIPITESENLEQDMAKGLVQDIQEAERCHLSRCYKGSVVLCRRAFQLALENRGATGRTLGPLLKSARAMKPPLLSAKVDSMAEGIKDFGDAGAHRQEDIEPRQAEMMIYVTVQALNELHPLAKPKEQGSNAG